MKKRGEMGIKQKSYETLSRVVHDAQLEALLVLEGFGQSAAQSVRWEHLLTAELELGKDALKPQRETAPQSKKEKLMQLTNATAHSSFRQPARLLWREYTHQERRADILYCKNITPQYNQSQTLLGQINKKTQRLFQNVVTCLLSP